MARPEASYTSAMGVIQAVGIGALRAGAICAQLPLRFVRSLAASVRRYRSVAMSGPFVQ
jgi:hypothetical protein